MAINRSNWVMILKICHSETIRTFVNPNGAFIDHSGPSHGHELLVGNQTISSRGVLNNITRFDIIVNCS